LAAVIFKNNFYLINIRGNKPRIWNTCTLQKLFGHIYVYGTFFHLFQSFLQNDEENALSQIIELIAEGTEIPDEYVESLMLLALNLSAKLELHDYFIYFKKLQISLLIELSKINEAIEEFADWDEILSDDIDFKNLKERLGI
jgi:hypothetical protein